MASNGQMYDFQLNPEIYSNLTEVAVNFEKFFLIGRPKKVAPDFTVRLTEMTYLPKVADPRRDWVASVAVPAFLAHAEYNAVRKFATIGTGAGLDAVAALDIFDLKKLAVTDLHPAVVRAAVQNIKAAAANNEALSSVVNNIVAAPGDLLTPLIDQGGQFDLIYENLPNIPLDVARSELHQGQTSSTYVPARQESISPLANSSLLALHWLALRQAKELLSPDGAVLSSMGARVPISSMIQMANSAGFDASVLTYTWKIQSEPEEVIGGYKLHQEQGLGPFFFYPAEVLEEMFKDRSPVAAASRFQAIEKLLEPHRLDAISAYEAHKEGCIIAHTVVVVRSTPMISTHL